VSHSAGSTGIQARAAKIRRLFLDIDGVMTDCKLYGRRGSSREVGA
jgi:3-deoxy-D-manno-octulosonate 8-phosphate phosphatase KdsC-like HAD superfamily phosphatase